jgi:phosphopantothenoylcysteine decarboxylase/phosphopantothenate--cysteine ligase
VSILSGKRILLGVTGGVAAYKAAVLARLLGRAGAVVTVAMTDSAQRFVAPATFQALTGRPVHRDLWDDGFDDGMGHIELSRQSDLVLVAPATADFLARLAQGRADDLLSTLCLARNCPLFVAPAMNRQMWAHPATRRNVQTIIADGVRLLGPETGEQACGEVGEGRLLEPESIVAALEDMLSRTTGAGEGAARALAGRRVLVTAGPTFEPIDTVRGITNRSSGKMGYAVAEAAAAAGASVTLVSGPTALAAPDGVDRVDVSTALEMHAAVMARASEADIFIGVAAVADYRVASVADHKLKKNGEPPVITLVENPDILAEVAALPRPPYCVGFAAETENLRSHAQAKRARKRVPLLAANLAQETFGRDDNALILFDDSGEHLIERAPKRVVAQALIAHIADRLAAKETS